MPDFSGRIVFDGYRAIVYNSSGVQIYSTQAISGMPDFQGREFQRLEWVGGLPEGSYSINTANISYRSLSSPLWTVFGRDSFGDARVGLEPEPGTDTFGRSGFMLHGGKWAGSGGCIDVLGNDLEMMSVLKQLGGRIEVTVDYSQYNSSEVHPLLLTHRAPTPTTWVGAPCFSEGTLVHLSDGTLISIEQIEVGDRVLAFDRVGALQPARVSHLIPGVTTEWIELDEGTRVTPGHRYLRPDGSFEAIARIVESDGLVVDFDGNVRCVSGRRIHASDVASSPD